MYAILVSMSEISLWLDSYDDIYSDFDSRHYLKRRISEDLIDELQSSLKYIPGRTENLQLLLPHNQRKMDIEKEIAFSIKEQFNKRLDILKQSARNIYNRGLMLVMLGVLVMAIDSLIAYKGYSSYLMTVLRIILEPAGWFLIWNGLDFLLYEYRKTKKDIDFFDILSQLNIHFKDS